MATDPPRFLSIMNLTYTLKLVNTTLMEIQVEHLDDATIRKIDDVRKEVGGRQPDKDSRDVLDMLNEPDFIEGGGEMHERLHRSSSGNTAMTLGRRMVFAAASASALFLATASAPAQGQGKKEKSKVAASEKKPEAKMLTQELLTVGERHHSCLLRFD